MKWWEQFATQTDYGVCTFDESGIILEGERLHDMPSPVRSSIHSKLLDGLDVNDCDGMARRAMSASQEFVNDLVYQCTRNWTVGDKVTLSGAKLSVKLPPWRSNYRADTFMTSQPEPICSLLFFIHGNICTGDDVRHLYCK